MLLLAHTAIHCKNNLWEQLIFTKHLLHGVHCAKSLQTSSPVIQFQCFFPKDQEDIFCSSLCQTTCLFMTICGKEKHCLSLKPHGHSGCRWFTPLISKKVKLTVNQPGSSCVEGPSLVSEWYQKVTNLCLLIPENFKS